MAGRRVGLTVVPFDRHHLAAASALAAHQVAAFREQVQLMPTRWSAPDAFVDRLAELVSNNPAFVALADGAVVGYMAGLCFEWSQGRWAFSPEWANQATGPDAGRIREELYVALAKEWMADDRRAHFISLLPTDSVGRDTMGWLGFGATNADGLRDLSWQGTNRGRSHSCASVRTAPMPRRSSATPARRASPARSRVPTGAAKGSQARCSTPLSTGHASTATFAAQSIGNRPTCSPTVSGRVTSRSWGSPLAVACEASATVRSDGAQRPEVRSEPLHA